MLLLVCLFFGEGPNQDPTFQFVVMSPYTPPIGIIPQSLSFVTFSIWKHVGHLLCRMSLNLGLSDVFSLGICIFNRQPPNEACCVHLRIIDQYQPNFCFLL